MTGESRNIDWEAVRRRLESSREALERVFTPTPDRLAAVFRERAMRLARAARAGAAEAGETEVLVFQAGAGRYGIELHRLAGVVAAGPCSPVPGAPPQLAGLMQVRGEIWPVWDAARLLDQGEWRPGESARVLLLRVGERRAGLRVDAVPETRRIPAGGRRPASGQPAPVRYMTADLVAVLAIDELLEQGLP